MRIGNEENVKKDCFAYNGKECKALDNTYCAIGECRFYKTEEQNLADEDKAFEKIGSLSYRQQLYIRGKYGLHNKMCEKGLII